MFVNIGGNRYFHRLLVKTGTKETKVKGVQSMKYKIKKAMFLVGGIFFFILARLLEMPTAKLRYFNAFAIGYLILFVNEAIDYSCDSADEKEKSDKTDHES